jgi:hypothetical protein
MNITLKNSDIVFSGRENTGKSFYMHDAIGWSTGDESSGFNRPDSGQDIGDGELGPVYRDSLGVAYPKPSQAAMIVLAYRNLYHKDDIALAIVEGDIVRDLSGGFQEDYSEHSWTWNIAMSGDGWYTLRFFLLDALSPSLEQLPTQGIYYDKDNRRIIDAALDQEIDSGDLSMRLDVVTLQRQVFLTTASEIRLQGIVGQAVDAAIEKGDCDSGYLKLQKTSFFLENQIAGAHVKFHEGKRHLAQRIIENLEKTDLYGIC